ncbi:hypothetical protein RRG08_024068 [Elysia crispata]|uniref:Uncharacterized protein n=1 Tax=Elysia crispata TaxID=231223 RepID=A0AAE0ZNU4_9GAST|nr:hypothetical protein RRG08_024068 [Elysia crispata]
MVWCASRGVWCLNWEESELCQVWVPRCGDARALFPGRSPGDGRTEFVACRLRDGTGIHPRSLHTGVAFSRNFTHSVGHVGVQLASNLLRQSGGFCYRCHYTLCFHHPYPSSPAHGGVTFAYY